MRTEEELRDDKKKASRRHLDKVRKYGPITHAKKSELKTLCNRTITYYMVMGEERVTCHTCRLVGGA